MPKYRADEPRPVVGPAGRVELLGAAVEQRGAHRLGAVAKLRVVGVAEAEVREAQAGQDGPPAPAPSQHPEKPGRRLGLLGRRSPPVFGGLCPRCPSGGLCGFWM